MIDSIAFLCYSCGA